MTELEYECKETRRLLEKGKELENVIDTLPDDVAFDIVIRHSHSQ